MAARKKPEEPKTEAKPRRKPAAAKAVQAVESGTFDAQTMAAMMAQMQTLLAEVQELRQVVASGAVIQPDQAELQLPDRFAQVIEDAESGFDENEVDAGLEEAESEALLAGFDDALSKVQGDSMSPIQAEEYVDQLLESVSTNLNDGVEFEPISEDELAGLMATAEAEAREQENLEEEFDIAEMEALLAAAGAHVSDNTDQSLSAEELEEALSSGLGGEEQDWNSKNEEANSDSDFGEMVSGSDPSAVGQENVGAAPQATLEGRDDVLSDDEIAAMLLGSTESTEPATTVAESVVEADDGVLSDDEIAAMLAVSTESVEPATSVAESVAEADDGVLSDDEIAALLSQADSMDESSSETSDSQSDLPDDDGPMLTEEELARLVRGEIERQDQELESIKTVEEKGATESGPDSTPNDGNSVLSADEIAALMNQPDLDIDPMPETSSAMDEDELAVLLAAAQDLAPASSVQIHEAPREEFIDPSQTQDDPVDVSVLANQSMPIDTSGAPDPGAVKIVPAHLAIRALALPMKFADGKLVCHVAEPVDQVAVDSLSKATGFGVVLIPKPIAEVVHGLRAVYSEVRDEHARLTLLTENEVKPTFGDKVISILRRIA